MPGARKGEVPSSEAEHDGGDRRGFLKTATSSAMIGGLAAGYGVFAAHAGRFLFPASTGEPNWQFVATIDRLAVGDAFDYTAPSGAKVVIARQKEGDTAEDFIALSSVCPHLGCQVHWESVNDRFFCPCHNGVFDASGAPREGPPAKANQHLPRYPLSVQNGLLYIDVRSESVATSEGTP